MNTEKTLSKRREEWRRSVSGQAWRPLPEHVCVWILKDLTVVLQRFRSETEGSVS